jgi:hypothetical protein
LVGKEREKSPDLQSKFSEWMYLMHTTISAAGGQLKNGILNVLGSNVEALLLELSALSVSFSLYCCCFGSITDVEYVFPAKVMSHEQTVALP